jgi:putative ABC transport system permease protein
MRLRMRAMFRRAAVEGELEEELRQHLERDVAERVRRGADPAVARREAALAFGGVERWKEECRDARGLGVRLLDELRQDLRFGLRSLRRSRAFTVVVVAILGVGIGLTAALFAAFHGVLLEPLPYRHEDRVVVVWQQGAGEGATRDNLAPATFLDLAERMQGFDAMAAAVEYSLDTMGPEGPAVVPTWLVSEGFFELLGSAPLLGRTFAASEHTAGRDRVVVLSHGYWQRQYGGDPGVVGRTVELDARPTQVVGIMPPGFAFPSEKDAWAPLAFSEEDRRQRFASYLHVVGRLAPETTMAAARGELDAQAARLAAEQPRSNEGVGFVAVPLRDQVVGDVRETLWILMSAVVLLLVVACSNVANLFMARTVTRERELAVRVALGAGRGRVRRQLLTEASLLAAGGCAVGVALAYQAVATIRGLAPAGLPRRDEIALDPWVLAFAAGVAAATVLAFALVPAAKAARRQPADALPGVAVRVTASARSRRLSRGLVVAGVALSFVLVVGAGLLLRSFATLRGVDPGYRADGILAVTLFLYGRYDSPPQQLGFVGELTDRLEALPGVQAVGFSTALPLVDPIGREDARVLPEGAPHDAEVTVRAMAVTPGYFAALRIPLREGRLFTGDDDGRAAPRALISQSLAERLYPGLDPVGRQLVVSFPRGPVRREVLGVVGDVRHSTLDERPGPTVYVPLLQAPSGAVDFVVRGTGDPAALVRAVSRQVWEISPTQPLSAVSTMDELRRSSLRVRELVLALLGAFAAAASLLAALGVYGVLSGATAERRREIGVRLALGARGRQILAGVLGEGARLALLGLVAGGMVAAAATRLLAGLLYDVAPLDAPTFLAAAALLLAAALGAGLAPAWRAASTDPAKTLAGD